MIGVSFSIHINLQYISRFFFVRREYVCKLNVGRSKSDNPLKDVNLYYNKPWIYFIHA